ncbi:MAG TPA: hypothetical protein VMW80_00835 [Candidatus Dormibacteraeota bacterium]|nr:hypothetical protein [Candidatus Dormibacteraeota bacterium]
MPRTPKIQTTAKGYEIPVPTRREVYAALGELAKVATPLPAKSKRRRRKGRLVIS